MAKPSQQRADLIDRGYTILRSSLIKGKWAIVCYTEKGGWARYSNDNYDSVGVCNEAIESLVKAGEMIINDDLPIY